MLASLKTTALAVTIALGGMMSMPVTQANAGGNVSVGVVYDTGIRNVRYRYDRRRAVRPRAAKPRRYLKRHRNRCAPTQALRKARALGLRRAYLFSLGPRGVVVKGRTRGRASTIGFAPNRSCRVLYAGRRR